MPFGRFKGKPVHKLPLSYLNWLFKNCDLSRDLREAVIDGFDRIEYNPPPKPDPAWSSFIDYDLVDEICKPWPPEE